MPGTGRRGTIPASIRAWFRRGPLAWRNSVRSRSKNTAPRDIGATLLPGRRRDEGPAGGGRPFAHSRRGGGGLRQPVAIWGAVKQCNLRSVQQIPSICGIVDGDGSAPVERRGGRR